MTLRFDIREYDELTSTNDLVKQAMKDGAPEGLVVCAKVQTAGYGRRGHKWQSGEGSLYMSALLRPNVARDGEASRMATLPLVVALAVRRAIASFLPARQAGEVKVKWPNDVVYGEAAFEGFSKMCGISTEWKLGAVCVGVGVNIRRECHQDVTEVGSSVTPQRQAVWAERATLRCDRRPDLCHIHADRHSESVTPIPRNLPTYMGDILGEGECPSVGQVRDAVLREFARVYDTWLAHGFAALRNEYMQCLALLGAEVRIDDAAVLGAGGSVVARDVPCCTVEGVTDDGMLAVRPCGSDVSAKVASGTVTIGHFLKNGEGLDHD